MLTSKTKAVIIRFTRNMSWRWSTKLLRQMLFLPSIRYDLCLGSPLPESFRPAKDVRLFQSRHNGQRYAPGYRSIVRLSGQTGDRSRGDGGISMLLGDLATIAQYKLPVKIIVFNNRSLGMVKLEMEVAGLPDNGNRHAKSGFCPGGSSDGYKELYRQPSGGRTPGIGRSLELTGSCSTECNDRSECTGYAPANRMESNDRIRTSHVLNVIRPAGHRRLSIRYNSNYEHLKEIL